MSPKPQPIKLSRPRATEILRKAAETTSLVFFKDHALKKMVKRRITNKQVLTVLKSGVIIEGPAINLAYDTWECLVQGFSAGVNIHVAVAIEANEENIIIITVFEVG